MRNNISAVAIALTVLTVAGSAKADILDITFTGTISSGSNSGIFGSQTDLSGDPFTATYKFDTSEGTLFNDNPNYEELVGGPGYGVTNPLISATLSIDGGSPVDFYFPFASSVAYFQSLDSVGAGSASGGANFLANGITPVTLPTNLLSNYSSDGTTSPDNVDAFSYTDGTNSADGNFSEANIKIIDESITSATPEPGTWALMAMGIGGLGFMLRFRRRSVTLSV